MKARLERIMDHTGLSPGKFAEEIGIQRSALTHILNERNKPSLDVVQKILNRFPEIDPAWFLSGSGSMIKQEIDKMQLPLFADEDLPETKEIDKPERENMQISPKLKSVAESIPQKEFAPLEMEKPAQKHSSFTLEAEAPLEQQSEPKPLLKAANEKLANTKLHEKQVSQIMVFYTDKTFSVYKPSED